MKFKLNSIILYVHDVNRLKSFYTQILGLTTLIIDYMMEKILGRNVFQINKGSFQSILVKAFTIPFLPTCLMFSGGFLTDHSITNHSLGADNYHIDVAA